MLKSEDIKLAYQLFLGREPENDRVINQLLTSTKSFEDLRDLFLKSPEFISSLESFYQHNPKVQARHPFNLPAIPVEVECSSFQLDLMHQRIAKEWQHLGEADPYWSVITQPHYHIQEFETHREQFFNSGKHTEDIFLATLRRCGINPRELNTCLDMGCGVGRVTIHLSQSFQKVIGLDISHAHLDLAQKQASNQKISNIEWIQLKHYDQVKSLPKVDAIISVIVLQHNPPPVIFNLIKDLLGLLNPGGAAYFQVPTYRNGYLFEVERYLNSTPPATLEMHFLPQQEVFKAIKESACTLLELREDTMAGSEEVILSNSFVVQKNR